MKVIVIAALLLVLAGVPAYWAFQPSDFGVLGGHPLGDFQKMEGWLLGRHYERQELGLDGSRFGEAAAPQGARIFRFQAPPKDMDGYSYHVDIVRDSQGEPWGVSAGFWSGSKDTGTTSASGAEQFARLLWMQISGHEPRFEAITEGSGPFTREARVAYLDDATACQGSWRKIYQSNQDERTIYDLVMICRAQ